LKGGDGPHLVQVLGAPGPDLAPTSDQHHTKVKPLPNQQPIALFEDAQRQHPARKQHCVQREERNQRPPVRGAAARQRSIQLPITSVAGVPWPRLRTASSTRFVNARDPSPLLASSGLPKRTSTGAGRKYGLPLGMTRWVPRTWIGTTGLRVSFARWPTPGVKLPIRPSGERVPSG